MILLWINMIKKIKNNPLSDIKASLDIFQEFGLYLEGHYQGITCVELTTDNKYLISTSFDGKVCIWNLQTLSIKAIIKDNIAKTYNVSIDKDYPMMATCSQDKIVRIYNYETCERVNQLCSGECAYSVILCTKLNLLISGASSGNINIWDLTKNTIINHINYSYKLIWTIKLTEDNQHIISGSFSGEVLIINLNHYITEGVIKIGTPISCICITLDKKHIIVGSADEFIRVYEFHNKTLLKSFVAHSHQVRCLQVTSDSKSLVSCSFDKTIKIWNLFDYELVAVLYGHTESVHSICISKDNQFIFSASWDIKIKIWSIAEKKLKNTLQLHSDKVTCLTGIDEKNLIVSGSKDCSVKVWNFYEKKNICSYNGHVQCIVCVGIHKNFKYIVSGSKDFIYRVWKINF